MDETYATYMAKHLATGMAGEKAAADFLQSNGFEILCLNFQNDWGKRKGELDIIAREGKELVFVEVKTRELKKYGQTLPEENITRQKLRKMARIADEYLRKNDLRDADYRFDAVSVWLDWDSRMAKIKHIRNIYL